MKEILVKTLMTERVSCLQADATLQQVINQMVENRYSCMVITEGDSPLGIVTERDLVKVLHRGVKEINLELPVSDFMSSPVFCLNQNDSLFDALVVSKAERVRHFPVVDDKRALVGLVTQSDLANAHFHVTELQTEMIQKSISAQTDELQKTIQDLQALSMEDHLMEVGNRRAMEVDLDHTHAGAHRYDNTYSVLLVDIDHFKLYNDHYGHQNGDDALKRVANLLKANLRKADRLYRYGGEELLVLLPHTDATQAEVPANKLVTLVANEAIAHEKSPFGHLTISCGGACVTDGSRMLDRWEDVVELADASLYEAKDSGRNRSIVSRQKSVSK